MPRGYAGPPAPDKGMPHRHTQQKIRLMLDQESGRPIYEDLLAVILKIAEKQPGIVLDALTDVLGGDQERKHSEQQQTAADTGGGHHGRTAGNDVPIGLPVGVYLQPGDPDRPRADPGRVRGRRHADGTASRHPGAA